MPKRLIHGHNRARTAGVSPTYYSWKCMKSRCDYDGDIKYHLYGGRGISYHESWSTFTNFLKDMGERPSGMTLDRIDSDGNYCASNCRWSTNEEQNRNRGLLKTNKTGVSGIRWEANRWRVKLGSKNIGRFRDFFEACCARKSAEYKQW